MSTNSPACPRDQARLGKREDKISGCRQCGRCGGLFLGAEALERALGHAPIPHDAEARLGAASGVAAGCPACGTAMRPLFHKGIEIDVCTDCRAAWFDAGEWERVANPASTRGSKFGKSVVLTGAAAAAGVAAVAAASTGEPGSASQVANAASDVAGGVGQFVADLAAQGAVEVVFEFIGEALGSLF